MGGAACVRSRRQQRDATDAFARRAALSWRFQVRASPHSLRIRIWTYLGHQGGRTASHHRRGSTFKDPEHFAHELGERAQAQ